MAFLGLAAMLQTSQEVSQSRLIPLIFLIEEQPPTHDIFIRRF